MESKIEKEPGFKIEEPRIGDELGIAPMHVQSWKETYVTPESGLTNEEVDTMLSHLLTDTSFRKNTIKEALENPEKVLYRVVRNAEGKIVGFMHGSKNDEANVLEGIYLLNEAKGSGVGSKLMDEFMAWIDKDKPTHLEVFSFNDGALRFYEKYGFVKTDKPEQLYKDRLPFFEMVRPIK